MVTGSGLRRAERLRRRAEFERAYEGGTRIHARFMTVFLVPSQGLLPRLGVAASKKLGSASDRNRAKRLARELFRRNKIAPLVKGPPPLDVVVVPRREMLDAPFASLQGDYVNALERAQHGDGSRSRSAPARRRRPRSA